MIKTDKFSDKDIIYLCNANPKIRNAMASSDEFSKVEKEVKKWMDISPDRLEVIKYYWNRNNK